MPPLSIAVVGSGISGLSAAWLLSKSHRVTLFESGETLGGHSRTIDCEEAGKLVPVDMGFIVYNEATYPNLTALFAHLGVPTAASDMGFSVSIGGGTSEYAGRDLRSMFGSLTNLVDLNHWRMLRDILRFFRQAERDGRKLDEQTSIATFLGQSGYSRAFIERHLLPMAAAIWSSPPGQMQHYPAKAFLRFFANHGLLQYSGRPVWRTVHGGSREYVKRLVEDGQFRSQVDTRVTRIDRHATGVSLWNDGKVLGIYDHVVIASHADQALAMLDEPSAGEYSLLSQFKYADNEAVLHRDPRLMPRAKRLWSSWNYLAAQGGAPQGVTYWMNALQPLATATNYFVSLNPGIEPDPRLVGRRITFRHPVFNGSTHQAQQDLWALQGQRRTWFCAAYFGAGFHEDGLQAGLAVAEQLGGVSRPWQVANESGRVAVRAPLPLEPLPLQQEAAE